MILYDDRQVAASFGDDLDEVFRHDLAFVAIFDRWSRDPARATRRATEMLSEVRDLLNHGALTTFYDANAVYVGHAVVADVIVGNSSVVLYNPAIVQNKMLWGGGPPNWLVHVEAVNGAAPMIIRRMRNVLAPSVESISYVRRLRGDVAMGEWRPPVKARSSFAPAVLKDHELAPFAKLRDEIAERKHILTFLTGNCDRPLSLRTAHRIASWAYNLKQYAFLRHQAVLLIWAWCNLEGLDRMRRERPDLPDDVDWNSGTTPVLVAVSGPAEEVEAGIRDWVASLPPGSDAPRRLVVDRLFDVYALELV